MNATELRKILEEKGTHGCENWLGKKLAAERPNIEDAFLAGASFIIEEIIKSSEESSEED